MKKGIVKLNFQDEELPYELFLTRQKSKIKAFAKNTSMNIKFSRAQLTKIIQSGGYVFGGIHDRPWYVMNE